MKYFLKLSTNRVAASSSGLLSSARWLQLALENTLNKVNIIVVLTSLCQHLCWTHVCARLRNVNSIVKFLWHFLSAAPVQGPKHIMRSLKLGTDLEPIDYSVACVGGCW